ncbi:putative membrane protein [Carp edema virus]|nr:putative membrane protein [Carp edema virus]
MYGKQCLLVLLINSYFLSVEGFYKLVRDSDGRTFGSDFTELLELCFKNIQLEKDPVFQDYIQDDNSFLDNKPYLDIIKPRLKAVQYFIDKMTLFGDDSDILLKMGCVLLDQVKQSGFEYNGIHQDDIHLLDKGVGLMLTYFAQFTTKTSFIWNVLGQESIKQGMELIRDVISKSAKYSYNKTLEDREKTELWNTQHGTSMAKSFYINSLIPKNFQDYRLLELKQYPFRTGNKGADNFINKLNFKLGPFAYPLNDLRYPKNYRVVFGSGLTGTFDGITIEPRLTIYIKYCGGYSTSKDGFCVEKKFQVFRNSLEKELYIDPLLCYSIYENSKTNGFVFCTLRLHETSFVNELTITVSKCPLDIDMRECTKSANNFQVERKMYLVTNTLTTGEYWSKHKIINEAPYESFLYGLVGCFKESGKHFYSNQLSERTINELSSSFSQCSFSLEKEKDKEQKCNSELSELTQSCSHCEENLKIYQTAFGSCNSSLTQCNKDEDECKRLNSDKVNSLTECHNERDSCKNILQHSMEFNKTCLIWQTELDECKKEKDNLNNINVKCNSDLKDEKVLVSNLATQLHNCQESNKTCKEQLEIANKKNQEELNLLQDCNSNLDIVRNKSRDFEIKFYMCNNSYVKKSEEFQTCTSDLTMRRRLNEEYQIRCETEKNISRENITVLTEIIKSDNFLISNLTSNLEMCNENLNHTRDDYLAMKNSSDVCSKLVNILSQNISIEHHELIEALNQLNISTEELKRIKNSLEISNKEKADLIGSLEKSNKDWTDKMKSCQDERDWYSREYESEKVNCYIAPLKVLTIGGIGFGAGAGVGVAATMGAESMCIAGAATAEASSAVASLEGAGESISNIAKAANCLGKIASKRRRRSDVCDGAEMMKPLVKGVEEAAKKVTKDAAKKAAKEAAKKVTKMAIKQEVLAELAAESASTATTSLIETGSSVASSMLSNPNVIMVAGGIVGATTATAAGGVAYAINKYQTRLTNIKEQEALTKKILAEKDETKKKALEAELIKKKSELQFSIDADTTETIRQYTKSKGSIVFSTNFNPHTTVVNYNHGKLFTPEARQRLDKLFSETETGQVTTFKPEEAIKQIQIKDEFDVQWTSDKLMEKVDPMPNLFPNHADSFLEGLYEVQGTNLNDALIKFKQSNPMVEKFTVKPLSFSSTFSGTIAGDESAKYEVAKEGDKTTLYVAYPNMQGTYDITRIDISDKVATEKDPTQLELEYQKLASEYWKQTKPIFCLADIDTSKIIYSTKISAASIISTQTMVDRITKDISRSIYSETQYDQVMRSMELGDQFSNKITKGFLDKAKTISTMTTLEEIRAMYKEIGEALEQLTVEYTKAYLEVHNALYPNLLAVTVEMNGFHTTGVGKMAVNIHTPCVEIEGQLYMIDIYRDVFSFIQNDFADCDVNALTKVMSYQNWVIDWSESLDLTGVVTAEYNGWKTTFPYNAFTALLDKTKMYRFDTRDLFKRSEFYIEGKENKQAGAYTNLFSQNPYTYFAKKAGLDWIAQEMFPYSKLFLYEFEMDNDYLVHVYREGYQCLKDSIAEIRNSDKWPKAIKDKISERLTFTAYDIYTMKQEIKAADPKITDEQLKKFEDLMIEMQDTFSYGHDSVSQQEILAEKYPKNKITHMWEIETGDDDMHIYQEFSGAELQAKINTLEKPEVPTRVARSAEPKLKINATYYMDSIKAYNSLTVRKILPVVVNRTMSFSTRKRLLNGLAQLRSSKWVKNSNETGVANKIVTSDNITFSLELLAVLNENNFTTHKPDLGISSLINNITKDFFLEFYNRYYTIQEKEEYVSDDETTNQELSRANPIITAYVVIGFCVVTGLIIFIVVKICKNRKTKKSQEDEIGEEMKELRTLRTSTQEETDRLNQEEDS